MNRWGKTIYFLQPNEIRCDRAVGAQSTPTLGIMTMTTSTQTQQFAPLDPDALPHAGKARAVTAVLRFLAGLGGVWDALHQARAAAEISRDLYASTASALAAHGITQAEVPDFVARRLAFAVRQASPAANDDTKLAPAA